MGDYTTIEMFGGSIFNYDTVILGVDFTCEYSDAYDTVSMYATVDFEKIGVDKSQTPGLKATTRKVWLGTYDLKGKSKVFGIWAGDETWVESVQFEYYPKKESTCKHSFTEKVTREGHCTKDAVVRHTCSKCGYEYEEMEAASGHVFFDKRSGEKIIRTCRDCGFAYLTDEPFTYECSHSYKKAVIKKADCETDGADNYTCVYCGDSYTQTTGATGHNYKTEIVYPTATDKGYTLHTCINCGDSYKDNETAALGGLADSKNNIVTGITNGGKYYTEDTLTFVAIGANSTVKPVEKAERYVFSDWRVTPAGGCETIDGTTSFIIHVAGKYTLEVKFDKQVYKNGSWSLTSESQTIKIDFTVDKRSAPPSQRPGEKPETNKPGTSKPETDKPDTGNSESDKPGTSIPDGESVVVDSSQEETSDFDSGYNSDGAESGDFAGSQDKVSNNSQSGITSSNMESADSDATDGDGSDMLWMIIVIAVAVVAATGVVLFILWKKNKTPDMK
jgi:hypothetical protein